MKVLLIKPSMEIRGEFSAPEVWFPDGLLQIGTVLKNHNIETKIVDFNNFQFITDRQSPIMTGQFPTQQGALPSLVHQHVDNNLLKDIGVFRPVVIGIGCFSSEAFASLRIVAEKVKDSFPDIPIVIGGIHPTIFAVEILKKYNYIDYVVLGEGEITFLELVKCIADSNRSVDFLDGIAFRQGGAVKLNPKTKFIENLDTLSFVDYSLIDLKDYEINTSHWYSPKKIKIGRPFSILSSRSCPERCNFCSMGLLNGRKIRFRSPRHVLDEIQYLYDNYDARYFHFIDDNMTFDKKRTLEICREIIKRNINIQFDTPNGLAIRRLDKETVDAMVAAGLVRVSLAIESGSDYIRNEIIRKRVSKKKIYEVVNHCASHRHLYIKLFFIVGMPEETHDTLQETYKMIKELPHDFPSIHFATPYPGTKLFDDCIRNGLLPYKSEEYVSFGEFHHDPEKPHFKPYKLTKEDLVEFRAKCYDYISRKKSASKYPCNYPMRYVEFEPKGTCL